LQASRCGNPHRRGRCHQHQHQHQHQHHQCRPCNVGRGDHASHGARFCDRILRSRMPLSFTRLLRLKRSHVRHQ
jgi:hypothetical protein